MIILKGLENLPAFINPVITIGTFDGVHFGHRSIIDRLSKRAQEIHGVSIIITFEPHPRLVLEGQHAKLSLLTTLDEKLEILQSLPIDYVVVVPFTKEFSSLSANEYIEQFIVNHFHPHTIIIGHDHHFGKNRSGNFALMETLKQQFKYALMEIPVQEIEHHAVSSTKIREAIQQGDMQTAADYLQRNYTINGIVVHGEQRGRTIGFPTANINMPDRHKLIPARGVYAVRIHLHDKHYQGMMNIGVRPTISASETVSLEVNLFDFDKDIYDQSLTIEFVKRIRDEQKFETLDALKHQLTLDKTNALMILNANY